MIVFVGYLALKGFVFHGEKASTGKIGMVLGVQSSGDPVHPEEIYVGSDKYRTINEMLAAQNVILYPEDKVTTFPDPSNGLGSIITIKRAALVKVLDGKVEYSYRTWAKTVGGLLDERNFELGEMDVVSPGVESKISLDLAVNITRVNETDEKEIIKIPFKTITKEDAEMLKGTQKIETKGVNGEKERIYHLRRENGKLVSKVLKSEKVTKEKVDEILIKGTKVLTSPIGTGVASWYIRTDSMIGACNLVKRGTKLKVTNLSNGKSIEVTSSGGGLRSDRIIDLSTRAFEALGVSTSKGTIPSVRVEKIL